MATQTIPITKQASPQTITIPLQAVTPTPTTQMWQQTTTFQCVCPARDTPVCPHHQHIITTGDDEETNNTGFYLRLKGQPQRHIDWENLMEDNTWTRCTQWAESSFPQQYTSPEQHQNITHIITGFCDFCMMGHRGVYSSDISRVEDQLTDEEDLHTRGSSRSRSNNGEEEDRDEAFEMIDHDMEDSVMRIHTIQTPSPSSFTLGLKTLPSSTNTLYRIVKGHIHTKNNKKNYSRRPASVCSSRISGMDMEEELDIIQNFEEEIGLLELDDKTGESQPSGFGARGLDQPSLSAWTSQDVLGFGY